MFQTAIINQLLRGIDPIHSKTINLKLGQIFQGKITNLYPGQFAQLQLGGLTLTAKLEASLEKGRSYWFQVTGGDHLPRLKVLENLPSLNTNQQQGRGTTSSEARSLPALLQQFNLPNTAINRQIVQQFIQENLPFTRANLSQGSALIDQSPLPRHESIQLLLQMIKTNMPITKETFNSMASLYSKQTMNDSMNSLLQLIQNNSQSQGKFNELLLVIRNLQNLQTNTNSSGATLQADQHINNQVSSQTSQPTGNQGNIQPNNPISNQANQGVNQSVNLPLTHAEGQQFNQLMPKTTHLSTNTPADKTMQMDSQLAQTSESKLPIFNHMAKLFGFQHEYDVRQQLQQANTVQEFQNLKAQLLLFLQETSRSSEMTQAREQAQFLVNRITAMQLMSSETQQPFQQIIMQFPVFLATFKGDLTVQWEGKTKKDGQIDDDHCRILFYLDLERLEETVVDVQIQNRIVSVTVYNEHTRPNDLIEMWQPLLKENLSHMNYQLSSLKWIKSEPKKEVSSSNRNYPLPLRDDRGYQGVDLRI